MRDTVSILPLTVEDLSFRVTDKTLLDGVDFTLAKGGVTTIIGPNGAGKSLTLRLCHGLITPTSGTITWNQAQTGRLPRRHAMVFQKPVMLRRSALANMIHALAASGADKARSRAVEAMARFGLSDLEDRPARLLSGGEQQRLAIARAWALEPELMLLDEPTSHLDPGATRQIETIIAALDGEGMTILMTTHDLGQARRLSGRILFMHKGRLVEDTTPDSFFSAPATAEARAFIAGDLLW